ncbi:MAG: M6 family metalloprotease domain-containing protein [Candidatus Aminicenantes bacterium]|nr:M6 family metalloprotease domain-containing protein [Candidatus Aminicenantes bacterium]
MWGRKGLVGIALLCASAAWALEPPTRAQLEQYARDGSLAWRVQNAYTLGNHLIPPGLVTDLRTRLDRLRSARMPGGNDAFGRTLGLPPGTTNTLKSKGTVKVLALLISFSDYPAVNGVEAITSKLFGDGDGGRPYESLRNFYRRASYNQLEIQGSVLGWYSPSYTRAGMPMTTTARQALIKEALTYFHDRGHDFSQYDNDGNGKIDYFIVVWTGPNNGWSNFWWGYQTSFSDASFVLDGKSFNGARYSWQWEARNWPGPYDQVVVMHETGHALGLPDYYDYDATVGPKGGLGGLDMMDANRGDHNAFSKMLLDWITPQFFNYGTQPSTLSASGNTPDALLLMPEFSRAQPFDEFFLVQNRFRVENDAALPGDGLLIWHVDARLSGGGFKYNNSYSDHKLLRLMEADGLEQIEKGYSATAADYYVQGKQIGPATLPDSNRYDASTSGVSVTGLGPSGPSMNFIADIHYTLYAPQAFGIQRLENDYIFFKLYDNRLTWELNPKNRTMPLKFLLYKKLKNVGDDVYILLAELSAGARSFVQKNLGKDELYDYRLVTVDINGATSDPADIGN